MREHFVSASIGEELEELCCFAARHDDLETMECILLEGFKPTLNALFACVWGNATKCFAAILDATDESEFIADLNLAFTLCATGRVEMLEEVLIWASERFSRDELAEFLRCLHGAEHKNRATQITIEAGFSFCTGD